jgi:PEP-CTERM motif
MRITWRTTTARKCTVATTTRSIVRFFGALTLGIAAVASTAGAQQINTGTSSNSIIYFGSPNTATYGQTFTALSGFSSLDAFSFQLLDGDNGAALQFRAFLMAWNGLEAVGPILYESGVQNGTSSNSPVTYNFSTGGVAITPGQVYVAFINASEFIAGGGVDAELAQVQGSSDTPGQFVFANNGGDFSRLTSTPWDCHDGCNFGGPGADVAFTATFGNVTATPEPATLTLMGTGFLGLGVVARRRKKAKPV